MAEIAESRRFEIKIDIKGLDLIIDKLGELGNEIETEAWNELVRLANAEIKGRARRYAPFDSGELKDSIGVSEDWHAGEIHVYADKFYAGWLEFGWWLTHKQLAAMAAKGILEPDASQHSYPQWTRIPFMQPAMDESIPIIEKGLKDKLGGMLK